MPAGYGTLILRTSVPACRRQREFDRDRRSGVRTAGSSCCSVCGDAECRTIKLGSEVFEVIPSELILKAALLAASEMVRMSELGEDIGTGPQRCFGKK
jgi:hypothetical protein